MSATAGTSLSGLTGVGTPSIVGQVNPEWEINGSISDKLRGYILRVDAGPTGLNAAEAMPPDVIEEFRRMVNAGVVRPKNEAASNYARAQGGLRAGDQTLLGPMIDGMPEGLTPEYWAVVIQKAQQVANERLAIMQQTGYFEGVPTMDRTRMEADIANQIAQTEIQRRLADNTIRQTDMDEAFRRDEMAQQMRQNIIQQFGYDPGPQGAAGLVGGNAQASVAGADGVPPIPGSPAATQGQLGQGAQAAPGSAAAGAAGAAGQTGPGGAPMSDTAGRPNMTMGMGEQIGWQYVPGSGWQRTVEGQQQDLATQNQAFAQQQAYAQAAANPRNYIEAQMLGGARGGLGGMQPNNQLTPTTQSPMTWNQMAGGLPGANIGQNVGNFMGQPGAQPMARPEMQGPDYSQQAIGMATSQAINADPQWTALRDQINQLGQSGQGGSEQYNQLVAQAKALEDQHRQQATEQYQREGGQMAQIGMPGGMGASYQQVIQQRQAAAGQLPGQANLGQGQPQQPNLAAQGFQAPGVAGAGMQGMQGPGVQGTPQQTAPNQVGVTAFSNALNKNRLVPGSGAMGTQGTWQTMGQIQQSTNPQKWRTQDFMRGNTSERQGALATASAAGFSDEDTQDMLKKSLPTFKAPGAGAMV